MYPPMSNLLNLISEHWSTSHASLFFSSPHLSPFLTTPSHTLLFSPFFHLFYLIQSYTFQNSISPTLISPLRSRVLSAMVYTQSLPRCLIHSVYLIHPRQNLCFLPPIFICCSPSLNQRVKWEHYLLPLAKAINSGLVLSSSFPFAIHQQDLSVLLPKHKARPYLLLPIFSATVVA